MTTVDTYEEIKGIVEALVKEAEKELEESFSIDRIQNMDSGEFEKKKKMAANLQALQRVILYEAANRQEMIRILKENNEMLKLLLACSKEE